MRTMIGFALVALLSSTTHVGAAPPCYITNTYSFPFGEPPLALCCTEGQPGCTGAGFQPEIILRSAGSSPRNCKISPRNHNQNVIIMREIRQPDPSRNIKSERRTINSRSKCNIAAGSYEHFICECRTSCSGPVTWSCNCPGVALGETPQAMPENFPQDSYKSKPELISRIRTPCNAKSTCEPFPPISGEQLIAPFLSKRTLLAAGVEEVRIIRFCATIAPRNCACSNTD